MLYLKNQINLWRIRKMYYKIKATKNRETHIFNAYNIDDANNKARDLIIFENYTMVGIYDIRGNFINAYDEYTIF